MKSETKLRIARQFSRAATHYNEAADVQLQVASKALSMLSDKHQRLLDVGSGTGRITAHLGEYAQQVLAVDLAEGMAKFARSHVECPVHWLVGDAESLPLQDNSVDGVFSSMALQWCQPIETAFAELYRVMKPGGSGVLAIVADGSLSELQQCWQQVDSNRHSNRFPTHKMLLNAATDIGFDVDASEQVFRCEYASVRQLLGAIKAIGANVVTDTGNHAPITRKMLSELEKTYDQYRLDNQQLPLSYRISFLGIVK